MRIYLLILLLIFSPPLIAKKKDKKHKMDLEQIEMSADETENKSNIRAQTKFQASEDPKQAAFNRLGDTFNSPLAKAAPIGIFSGDKVFRGKECAEKLQNGTYETFVRPLILTFNNQGFHGDQVGMSLHVNVPEDKFQNSDYIDSLRKSLVRNDQTHKENMEYIAKIDNDKPVKDRSLIFDRQLIWTFSRSGPFHSIEYEVREVQIAGQKEYIVKSTEFYTAFMEYQKPSQVKRVTYCW